jgi:MYXO-CTERM domain-containing protein
MVRSKLILVCAGLLILPAMAWGAHAVPSGVTVDLVAGTHVAFDGAPVALTGPTSAISAEFGVGGSFDLWMIVETDGDIDGFQWDFTINGANSSSDIVSGSPKASPSYYGAAAGAEGYGSLFCSGFGCGGLFAIGDYSTISVDVFDDSIDSELVATAGAGSFVSAGNFNGGASLVGYDMAWGASLPVGTYTVSLSPGSFWTSQDASHALLSGSMQTPGSSFVLTITPEPATALLLLGALPFLRRRRS